MRPGRSAGWTWSRDASRTIRQLAWNGLRRRHPHADETELRRRYVVLTLGEKAAEQLFGPAMS